MAMIWAWAEEERSRKRRASCRVVESIKYDFC